DGNLLFHIFIATRRMCCCTDKSTVFGFDDHYLSSIIGCTCAFQARILHDFNHLRKSAAVPHRSGGNVSIPPGVQHRWIYRTEWLTRSNPTHSTPYGDNHWQQPHEQDSATMPCRHLHRDTPG